MKRTYIDGAALTPQMATVLLEHAGGPWPTHATAPEIRVLKALWTCGLVSFNRTRRPKYTAATNRGRKIIARMLVVQSSAYVDAVGQRREAAVTAYQALPSDLDGPSPP